MLHITPGVTHASGETLLPHACCGQASEERLSGGALGAEDGLSWFPHRRELRSVPP